MNDVPDALPTPSAATPAPRRNTVVPWLLCLIALGGAGWLWYDGHQRTQAAQARAAVDAQRLEALESRLDGLRRDVRGHAQRLQQADATNRVLRDELLGIGQRSTILEGQVAKLADANRHGAQALRMDEAELLLSLGQQRLLLSSDLDGARRAYALAAGILDGVDSPGMLNLRQALAQERADLDALKADPRRVALDRLDAFATALPAQTAPLTAPAAPDAAAPWWRRALGQFVTFSRSDASVAVGAEERSAGLQALQLELTLARAAAERRDAAGLRAALARADLWLRRLWPDSPQRRALEAQLRSLSAQPLALEVPTLGSSLEQLRSLRGPT